MKKLAAGITILLLTLATFGQVAYTLLPENEEWTIAWDQQTDGETLTYRLRVGTNVVRVYATNEVMSNGTYYKVTSGVTNLIAYYSAKAPALMKGTNSLTLTAVNLAGSESDPSNVLLVKALGKPLAPQALRKP